MRHGNVIAEKISTCARLQSLMSVTRSIVGLLVRQLIDAQKIASVDVPLTTYFPEWNGDAQKNRITLREVLTQTSGIADKQTTEDIYASQDFIKLALDAPIAEEPGTTFRYNNKATNLLGAVIERASGMKMDAWARAHFVRAARHPRFRVDPRSCRRIPRR